MVVIGVYDYNNTNSIVPIVAEDDRCWYTHNFDITYYDIIEGLNSFIKFLKKRKV